MTTAAEKSTDTANVLAALEHLSRELETGYVASRRVLSFGEYAQLFSENPTRHGRDAARYLLDAMDHYGRYPVVYPWGTVDRFALFDQRFGSGQRAVGSNHGGPHSLVGQEETQAEVYRAVANFVRDGRANRLVLMHGPNGSAKSTFAACLLNALEHYSALDAGALYRFHWVFPSRKATRGAVGFDVAPRPSASEGPTQRWDGRDSYAHLPDSAVDARLAMELRDHPLFLLPVAERKRFLTTLGVVGQETASLSVSRWLLEGRLCHKNQQVLDALLAANQGNLYEVLRHVQVERYYISRRYRVGAVSVNPAAHVDAGERQITADRSLAALPTALQAVTLFEAFGELVEASGGVVEFSDLLKRPLESYRYLQQTLESGEVHLAHQTVQTNCVMIGSANDVHLSAFREHHEFPSFRGRLEMLRVPYLRSVLQEQAIYDEQIVTTLRCPVAPYATRVAAEFAILTRLLEPDAAGLETDVAGLVATLSPVEKMELYTWGSTPERFAPEERKLLSANIPAVYYQFEKRMRYEGAVGASPREMRTLLLDAAQSSEHAGLSPFGVLSEIEALCDRVSEFDWLRLPATELGYHDHRRLVDAVRSRLLESLEGDMQYASGLIEEGRYRELFSRYVTQVMLFVRGEKVRNEVTGEYHDPDERLMGEVEERLGVKAGTARAHRDSIIAAAAAWGIERPGEQVDIDQVFRGHLRRFRDAMLREQRGRIGAFVQDLHDALQQGMGGEGEASLQKERRNAAAAGYARLQSRGYDRAFALEASGVLLRTRFAS